MKILVLTWLAFLPFALPPGGHSQEPPWDKLKQLRPSQNIQVVDQQLRSLDGKFLSVSEEDIRLVAEKNEVTVKRGDVFRVSLRRGSRGKHVLIGLGIGAAAGAGAGGIAVQDDYFGPLVGAVVFGVIGTAVGGTVGAVLPAGRGTLYQAEKQ